MIQSLIALLLIFNCCLAQVQKPGKCPGANVIDDFDVAKYLGVWYEQEKYPAPFEINGKCAKAEYTLADSNTVKVVNSMIDKSTEILSTIEGTAKIVENGKLLVKFPSSPPTTVSSNYWVLDTDYSSYSVVFSCTPISTETNFQIVWILTRDRIVSDDLLVKCREVLSRNGISISDLTRTEQNLQCFN